MNSNGNIMARLGIKKQDLKEIESLLEEEKISEAITVYRKKMKSGEREAKLAIELIQEQRNHEDSGDKEIPEIEISRYRPPCLMEEFIIEYFGDDPALKKLRGDSISCIIKYPCTMAYEDTKYDGKVDLELEVDEELFFSLDDDVRKSLTRSIVERLGFRECFVMVRVGRFSSDSYPESWI